MDSGITEVLTDSAASNARWARDATTLLLRDARSTPTTPMVRFPLPEAWGIELFLKDESQQPTGSLKHRLARSLFLDALTRGVLTPTTTAVEASSGSTAVSEAYFAHLLGLPYIAVMPRTTSPEKIARVEQYEGRAHLVDDPAVISLVAEQLADSLGGYHLDQFHRAGAVTDWTSENSLSAEMMRQLAGTSHPIPTWVVLGVGTGGTSTGIGRYRSERRLPISVAAVDPEGSAYFDAWRTGKGCGPGSRIEGIGRPHVESSFTPSIIDAMMRVPDRVSIAAARLLGERGLHVGGSTGTGFAGALRLIAEMRRKNEQGSLVVLICDSSDRYRHSYFNDDWTRTQGLELEPARLALSHFLESGIWSLDENFLELATSATAGEARRS